MICMLCMACLPGIFLLLDKPQSGLAARKRNGATLKTGADIAAFIVAGPQRLAILRAAMGLGLPDCWIGAGFVRNPVWDHLHGQAVSSVFNDVDVVYFNRENCSAETDAAQEVRLRQVMPDVPWSVLNMARMHIPTGDPPYHSTVHGISFWPEIVTAIAVRLDAGGAPELAAPYGVDDLLALRVRPTPAVREHHPEAYPRRLVKKNWLVRWPRLQIEEI
jgi:hypothetical protein